MSPRYRPESYGSPHVTSKPLTDIVGTMAFLPFRDRTRIMQFRWPAIAAGLSVALGTHIVLTAFGLGVVFLQSQSAEGASSTATAALLLWSGLCFMGLTVSNGLLFIDLVMLPGMDLYLWRLGTAAASMLLLLYGLIWESGEP